MASLLMVVATTDRRHAPDHARLLANSVMCFFDHFSFIHVFDHFIFVSSDEVGLLSCLILTLSMCCL
jgi:hypothetical protein